MKDCFSAIVGNEKLCKRLENDILNNKLPHAFILEGPYGTGKHTVAKNCAAALVCSEKENPTAPLPCLSCVDCRKVMENKSPDVIYINRGEKASIGVDVIRFLKEDVRVVPNDSEKKIYIIEEADKMTVQAQNALLLTLEEPPSYVHFFLLCESSETLLETIKSRAPILRTEQLSKEQISDFICSADRRAAQMKLSDPSVYKELLVASGFGIGRALEYLDAKKFLPVRQTRAFAEEFLTTAIKVRNTTEVLPVLGKFSTKRDTFTEQLSMIQLAIRDLLVIKKSDSASLLFFSDEEKAMELSDLCSIKFLYELNQAINNAKNENEKNANLKLCITKMAIDAKLL